MREIKEKQITVITDADPAAFQSKINKTLQEHKEINGIEYNNNIPGYYSAIITYTERRNEPENTADEYQLAGKRYICNDCPHLDLDPDRRSHTHYCLLHRDRVTLRTPACEEFLSALKAGFEHLVTPEERRAQYDIMDREDLERRRKKRNEIARQFLIKQKILQAEKELKELREGKTSEK